MKKMTGPQIYTKFTQGGRVQKENFKKKSNLYILSPQFSSFLISNLVILFYIRCSNITYTVWLFGYLNRRSATYTQNCAIIDMILALLTQRLHIIATLLVSLENLSICRCAKLSFLRPVSNCKC